MRKMHLAMRAAALAVFPGSALAPWTSYSSFSPYSRRGRHRRLRSCSSAKSYWRKLINFEISAEEGMISPEDLQLFEFAENAQEGWASLVRRGLRPITA